MRDRVPQRITWRQIATWSGPKDRAVVVIAAALSFALAFQRQGWGVALVCALLGAITAMIAVIDHRHFRIPDLLSLPLIPLGLMTAALTQAPLLPRLLAMGAIWGVMTVLQKGFFALRGRSGLGAGDVKLMAAAAVWLDPSVLPIYVLAAATTALIEGWIRRAGLNARIAFGAHLAPWISVFVLGS